MTTPTVRLQHPILLLAAQSDLIGDLVHEAAMRDADPRMARFIFDAAQSYRFEDAKLSLSRGYEGRPYAVLLIGGDVATSLGKKEYADMVAAATNGAELAVVGLADADDSRGRAALASLGVTRVCPLVTFRHELPLQIQAAAADIRSRREKAALEAATGGSNIVVNTSPKEGLLRDNGVITVHSTKGGSGKTTISTNLAWALAASGRSTVLVDLNADGANCHSHLLRYIKRSEGLDEIADLFDERGLSLLARRMRHDTAYGIIPPQDLAASLVRLTPALDFLPGVRDQADYQAGVRGGDQTVANLLKNPRWVENLIDQLRAPGTGHSYVIIDTGTARYTAFGFSALARCDLVILVVNASMPSNMAADITAAQEMMANMSNRLRGRKILIANQLQRDIPGAPTLTDVKRRFEFFAADRVLPLHADWAGMTTANIKGMPYLADPRNFETPLGRELIGIVNAISEAYDLGAGEKSGGSLLGRFRGRN